MAEFFFISAVGLLSEMPPPFKISKSAAGDHLVCLNPTGEIF